MTVRVHAHGAKIQSAKYRLQSVLAWSGFGPLWKRLVHDRITIFMLHRFAVPELGVNGCRREQLHAILERLRRERFDFIDVEQAVNRLCRPPIHGERPAVVFTVDDGYFDFGDIAADVFLAFDCPATLFVTTGFLEGQLWQWWDRISYIISKTEMPRLHVTSASLKLDHNLVVDGVSRRRIARHISRQCTQIPHREKLALIERLAAVCEVDLPRSPPDAYKPICWSDAQRLEGRGLRFGPHSVSHPILPHMTAEAAEREIAECWHTLQLRLRKPAPIFAYPNGNHGDREVRLVQQLGLHGAFTTTPRYASGNDIRSDLLSRFRIPRLPLPERPDQAYLDASGFSRIPGMLWGATR